MKFNWKMSKDKWVILLAFGLILLILAVPSKPKQERKEYPSFAQSSLEEQPVSASLGETSYEAQLEKRVKQILRTVEGVGQVEVMIVLKSSEEKVLRMDVEQSKSSISEQDSSGGTRQVSEESLKESTILNNQGSGAGPIIEKEIMPEIAGMVISAEGGGSPGVKAEISTAMEALFGIPSHKIKVLKRVE